jgi:hypothetical protein
VFAYSIRRRIHQWPSRAKLLEDMLKDKKFAEHFMSDREQVLRVGESDMLQTGLFNTDNAVLFLELYGQIESLKTGEEREDHELDHNKMLLGFEELAHIARQAPEGMGTISVVNFRKSIKLKKARSFLSKIGSVLPAIFSPTLDRISQIRPVPITQPTKESGKSSEKEPDPPECSMEDV